MVIQLVAQKGKNAIQICKEGFCWVITDSVTAGYKITFGKGTKLIVESRKSYKYRQYDISDRGNCSVSINY